MNKVFASVLMVGLILIPAFVRAEELVTTVSSAIDVAPVEVGNKICPVSGEKIGEEGMEVVKITHKGRVYNLCCNMCEKDFNKDPDKYAKIADDEVAGVE